MRSLPQRERDLAYRIRREEVETSRLLLAIPAAAAALRAPLGEEGGVEALRRLRRRGRRAAPRVGGRALAPRDDRDVGGPQRGAPPRGALH